MEKIYTEWLSEDVSFDMVLVEGGVFERESPKHEVFLDDYYIGKFPVTQVVWKAVMKGQNPSFFQGDNRPIESVSWIDCQEFIQKLNAQIERTYRLPTEAEWEYAARGGQESKEYLYAGSNNLTEVGWYEGNSDGETKPVGLHYPNELGLYDMSGNVNEWCLDWYNKNFYKRCANGGIIRNPHGPELGDLRVIRGGGWLYLSSHCLNAERDGYDPKGENNYLGLRLVLSTHPHPTTDSKNQLFSPPS